MSKKTDELVKAAESFDPGDVTDAAINSMLSAGAARVNNKTKKRASIYFIPCIVINIINMLFDYLCSMCCNMCVCLLFNEKT